MAKSLLGDPIQETKLKDLFGVQKSTDFDEPKAAVACLKYLLISGVRFSADVATFNEELQQLGLPKEHSSAICKVFEEYGDKIRNHQILQSLTVNKLENVTLTQPQNTIDCIQLDFEFKNEIEPEAKRSKMAHSVIIEKKDIPALLKELKTVNSMLAAVDFK